MKVFTSSDARQNFAKLLEEARRSGSVRIRRRDGQVFLLKPDSTRESPLDVKGIRVDVNRDEIVSLFEKAKLVERMRASGIWPFGDEPAPVEVAK